MFLDDGDTSPYATFEPNFFAGWAHTMKNMHPELTTKVRSVIYECWRAGENKELGKVKISAAGVYDDRLQLQKTIRLSELPLSGKIQILAVYKSIGSKPQVSSAGSYKRGRPFSNAGVSGRKKAKVCDMLKDLE